MYFEIKEFLTNIVKSNFDYEQFIDLITNANITNEILRKLPKTTILEFQNILKKYSKLLNVNKIIIDKIDNISNEYTKNDNIIVLTPTLSNLLNCEVNKLEFKNSKPHGNLWKNRFRNLLNPILNELVFPRDLLKHLINHMKNPKSSFSYDIELSKVIDKYDLSSNNLSILA